MRTVIGRRGLLLVLISGILTHGYIWPSPQYDALEELLYEGASLNRNQISNVADPCRVQRNLDGSGNSTLTAARWLRFAFHDMATHNITDGTGGLDGSIIFELDRPENIGRDMLETLLDFERGPTKYISRADVIAMGAIFGVAACGGPIIPFRGGRIDAMTAGRSGVPEPDQDLKSHIESFRLQGFNQSEMIALVACGHTFGGVNAVDFPTIVPLTEVSPNSTFKFFDSSEAYDEKIVSSYLDGSTIDPLVFPSNKTFASDLTIFSSDNNVTVTRMNSPTSFAQECATLLERMINTVPSSVNLTDEIKLLPAKVQSARLTIEKKNLVFKVNFRLFGSFGKDHTVRMLWCDRRGTNTNCANSVANVASPAALETGAPSSQLPRVMNSTASFNVYQFVVPIDSTRSVSKFWFEVNEGVGTGSTIYDNEGSGGYQFLQDLILYVPSFNKVVNGIDQSGTAVSFYRQIAGIRTDVNVSRAFIQAFISDGPIPSNETFSFVPDSSIHVVQGYSFYAAEIQDGLSMTSVDVSVVVDGREYTDDYLNVEPPAIISPSKAKTVTLRPGSLSSSGLSLLSTRASAPWTLLLSFITFLIRSYLDG